MRKRLVQAGLALIAFLSGLVILGDVLGTAAWCGINFAMFLYLSLATAGTIGLLVGLVTTFSRKVVFAWISSVSITIVATLSLIFLVGFLFERTQGVPLDSPLIIRTMRIPIIAIYAFTLLSCATVAWRNFRGIRNEGVKLSVSSLDER